MVDMIEDKITQTICSLDDLICRRYADYTVAYPDGASPLLLESSDEVGSLIRQKLSSSGLGDPNETPWRLQIAALSLEKRVLEQGAEFAGSGLTPEQWIDAGKGKDKRIRALFRLVEPTLFVFPLEGKNGEFFASPAEVRTFRRKVMPEAGQNFAVGSLGVEMADVLLVRQLIGEIAEDVKGWKTSANELMEPYL